MKGFSVLIAHAMQGKVLLRVGYLTRTRARGSREERENGNRLCQRAKVFIFYIDKQDRQDLNRSFYPAYPVHRCIFFLFWKVLY